MNSASIVSKVWSFCATLRDDGVGYGDYLEPVDPPDLSQDGGRVRQTALRPRCRHPRRLRLAESHHPSQRGA